MGKVFFFRVKTSKIIKGRGKTVEIIDGRKQSLVVESDNPVDLIKKELSDTDPSRSRASRGFSEDLSVTWAMTW